MRFSFQKRFFGLLIALIALSSIKLTGQDFEVAPAKIYYDCEPGQIQTKILYVRNHANEKQQFNLVPVDMPADSLGTKKKDEVISSSCKDWITLNPPFFDLNPNETKEIQVTLQTPSGHSETRWCMIYVSAVEEQTALTVDKQMRSGVKVRPRIGIKVIQSPKSNRNYKGSISGFKEVTLANDSLRSFEAIITNSGDKEIQGKIFLVLSNLETADEIKQKPIRASLMPGSSKKLKLELTAKAPAGKYSLAAIFDYGNNAALEAAQIDIEIK